MKLHRNARTTPMSRFQLVTRVLEAGWTYQEAAAGSGVSRRTVANGSSGSARTVSAAWKTNRLARDGHRTSRGRGV